MDETKRFYVYAHILPDGTPFYVGKGSRNRVVSKANRSLWWKSLVNKHYGTGALPTSVILSENLDEQESLDVEKYWIALFGRKKVHSNGTLINHTDGGDGLCNPSKEVRYKIGTAMRGKKRTVSARRKTSATLKANHPMRGKKFPPSFGKRQSELKRNNKNMLGKKHSAQSKLKMSLSHMGHSHSLESRNKIAIASGAREVLLKSPTGQIVSVLNQSEFCRQHNLISQKVCAVINKKAKTHKGWKLYTE